MFILLTEILYSFSSPHQGSITQIGIQVSVEVSEKSTIEDVGEIVNMMRNSPADICPEGGGLVTEPTQTLYEVYQLFTAFHFVYSPIFFASHLGTCLINFSNVSVTNSC